MIDDVLARLETMAPMIAEMGGLLSICEDADGATFKAVRHLGPQWLCLIWMSAGAPYGDNATARAGASAAELHVAIARRPALTVDRAKAAKDAEDDYSLYRLWNRVRGLFASIRWGTVAETGVFTPRAGYLDGNRPMKMNGWNFSRKTFEIAEAGSTTKGMKELLWAETRWEILLALPMEAVDINSLSKYWVLL